MSMIAKSSVYVLVCALIFTSTSLMAQESAPEAGAVKKPEVRTKVIYKEKSYYDFEDTLIRGDREGPGGLNVFRKDRVKFKSQLNLSRSFMPELKASASEAQ